MKIQTSSSIRAAYADKYGTLACTVRVRLTAEQESIIRSYYNMDPNRPMFCRTRALPEEFQYEGAESAEMFSQGNGWFLIYGDGIHVNDACRTLDKIEVALKLKTRPAKGLPASVIAHQEQIRTVYAQNRRVVVVVKTVYKNLASGKRIKVPVAVTRAVQADENRVAALAEHFRMLGKIRQEPLPLMPRSLEAAVGKLQSKFQR